MAKIVKTLTVSWQWSGDKYSLRGFNLAVTPTAKNPKEEVVATAFVETNEIKQTYSYKMGNVTLDKDAQYKIWVQAVYENSDSDWVSTGGATVTDDGSATIITKTDREIQDIANMASDNILTRQEKVGLRREWQEIVYEFLEIESTAVGQGIPSSNTALSNFKSKGNALGTYLNGGTAWTISSSNKTSFPLWINDSNLGSNTSINGNTYRETFRAYYEAKVKILEEIGTHKIDNVQIGATNIIRNSSNPKTLTHWKSGTGFSVAKSELLGENVFRILTTDATEKYGSTDRYKVEPNCQYTFAMDVYMDANVTSLDVFWLSRAKGSTSDYDSVTHFIQAWKDTKSKWVRITGTFTTKATDYEGYIRIDNNGTTNSTTLNGLWFTKVKLEKGNKATDWSPALEDMENAYTIVLTNEAQVIPTNSSRVPTSSTVYHTDVQVYQGTTQRTDYTIGTVNSANGITVSKTASRVSFSVSTETALTVDGGNFTIPITIDGKTFNKTFSWSCSKQGNVGNSGVGISSITEYYAVSSSNTTAPTSWSTTVPTMTSTNKYLWNYEAIKYTNNTTKETAKRVIGAYGDKGATGGTGETGNGISNITNYYLATSSSSGVTTSTSGWTTSVQSVSSSKKYLWNYEVVTYTNGSTNTTTPCIIGTYGDKGDKGDQGDAYTVLLTNENHTFPCANNGNIASAISTTTTVTAYKGATSVTPTIGTLPSVTGLTLSKSGATVTVQANTGTSLAEHGSFNIPVTVDGKSFTKTFSWSKSKQGATGLAKSADIMATGQVFKSSDGGATYTPSAITLTPSLQNVSFSNWQYSTTGTGSWTTVVSGQNGLTISGNALAISKDSPLFTKTQTSMVFRLNTNDSAIYDTMTIVKLNDMAEVVIGGRNLVSKSYVAKRNSAGSFDDATNTWTLTATAGNTDTWGCGLAISGNKVLVPYGQTYVLSFEIKVPRTCSWNTDVNNYAASGSSWSGNDNDEGSKRKTSSKSLVANQWVKCWLSWSNTHSSNTNKVDLYDNTNFGIVMKNETSDMTFQIRNVKGELGTVPTDWSPAPIDVANDISTAQNAAESAQSTANSAKTEATNATNKLSEIASDSKLTASEKQQVSRDWEEIKLEKPSIINQANVYSISTTAFTNAYTALETYVGTLNLTSTSTTTITPSDFKSKFNAYYTQRQAILDEVAKKAKKHADDLVANVNIGGRNLMRYSAPEMLQGASLTTKWSVGRGTIKTATLSENPIFEGKQAYWLTLASGSSDAWACLKNSSEKLIQFSPNIEYTLSFKSYIGQACKGIKMTLFSSGDSQSQTLVNYEKTTQNQGEAYTKSVTFKSAYPAYLCIYNKGLVTGSTAECNLIFSEIKIEKGNKASDWSPAPEDTTTTIDTLKSDVTTMISGVQDQVDGKVETFYQADDPASAWTTTALKNAHKGDIWYKTTDSMTYRYSGTGWVKLADGDAKSAKDLASSKKRVFTATPTVPYDVGDLWVTALNETGDLKVCKTARTSGSYTASDWVKATDYIDSTQAGNIAQGKVDAQTQATIFNKLTNNGATQGIFLDGGKIWINGEYVKANSITADRLSISDFTNYAQLNNNTATKYGFTKGADETDGAWLKRNSMARDIFISDYYTCNGGESFRIKYDISTTIKGNSSSGGTDSTYRGTAIGLYCYNGSGASVGIVYSTRYTNQTVNGSSSTVKIPTTARKFRVFIQTDSYGNWSGELKVRNIQVTKMAGGELIVDGSVTASKIAANTITADKLHADVLSANSIVSTINGGSTNISGNKIRTGTIQSNNGKSTINLDNGSMNLGATSDASYLQWTGSALNIKANSINIGTSSVATTTQLTEKIDGIQVGIRNLARPTSGDWASKTGFNGGENQTWYPTRIYLDTLSVGDEITYSYDIEYSGITVNNGSSTFRLVLQGAGNSTGWNTALPSKAVTLNIGSGSTRISHTFKLTAEQKKNSYFEFGFRTDHVNGGTIKYRCGMASKGNKVVQWTPAPEDVNTAINNKANSADVYKKSEVYTQTETNTQITTAKNEINQSVSSTYETKANVDTKINSIDIGGKNLVKQTKLLTDVVLSGWTVTNTGNEGFKKLEIVTTNTSWQECNIPLYTGINTITKSVTISFEYQETSSGLLMFNFGSYNGNTRVSECSNITVSSSFKVISTNGSWKTVCYTFDPTSVNNKDGITQYKIQFKKASGKTGTIYVRKPKLELGNKATDWSPAPEDVETTVSTIEKRVTSAESKITDTAITNTVKKNFYTKTETEEQITNKGYQTESQVQQTVNNLQIKFTESGGYNLLKNGKAAANTNFWISNGGGIGRNSDPVYKTCFKTSLPTGIKYNGGDSGGSIRLKNNTHYVYEAMVYSRTAIGGSATSPLHYWCNTTAETAGQAQCTVVDYSQKVANINTWTKCYVHFVTKPSGEVWFTPFIYTGGSLTGDIWVTELSLSESSVQTPYSPNPNEVYDGIIEMDKNGIKVSTSNGGWTDFTSVGMNVYNKSSQLSLGTRNGGLTYHGGGQYLGFTSASIIDAYNTRGVCISTATGGAYLTLGYSSATDPFGGFTANPCLSVAKQDIGDSSSFYRQGLNVHTTLNLNTQHINRMGTINFATNNASKIYHSTLNNLCMYGDNGVALGYREGDNNATKLEILEGSKDIRSYAHWQFNQWNLNNVAQLEVVSRLKMQGTSSIYFNANATHPSVMWHSSNDNKLNIFGDNGVDIGYRVGDNNNIAIKITEGESGAYRIQSFSHWHFHNWNLDYVGNVHAQKFTVAGTSGSYYITKGTGDGADYTTYGCLFYTHNGLAFTANGGAATVIVQGRSGRIMGKNAYYVNSSKCLKSDIRAVTSEREPMPVNLKQGEVVDETLTMEMIGDFIDTIGIRTYITDFEQEGATQKDVDPQQGHVLNLGYIADDLAHHPVFKYIGEKTPDNLYAINSNGLTTVALAGLQAERKERRKLEQRLQKLEAMLLKGEE